MSEMHIALLGPGPEAMTIKEFAELYRLKVKRDECGDPIIPGRFGHVYEHSDTDLGVYLCFGSVRKYNFAAKRLRAHGCIQRQDAETEGTLLFVPTTGMSRLVLRIAGIKRRRIMSEAQKRSLDKARQASPLILGRRSRAPEAVHGDKRG
jgi:hypothetical protein